MKKGWYWPVLIVGLLVVSAGTNIVVMIVATNDPSFAVEEDYYRKAVAWDDRRAQEARNRALGWSVDLAAVPSVEAGVPVLQVLARVADAAGDPVEGAVVRAELFPIARANQIERLPLNETNGGNYGATVRYTRSGLWEFRLEIVRGEDRFTEIVTRELQPSWPR